MAETNTRITFAVAQPWVGVSVTRCPCWTTLGKQTKLLCASDSSCVKRREKVPNLKESRSKRAQRACRGLGPGSEPSITFTTTATNYYALNNSWLLLLVTLFPFPVLSPLPSPPLPFICSNDTNKKASRGRGSAAQAFSRNGVNVWGGC